MVHKISTSQRMQLNKPLEIWQSPDGTWKWYVFRKYQKPETEAKNPYARWFCKVTSPYTEGDFGDVYVKDIKESAVKVFEEKE